MIKPVHKSYKIVGVLARLIGLLAFFPLINFTNSNLVWDESNNFIFRYSLVIFLVFGGLYFIVMGVLQYFGILLPYYKVGEKEI